MQLLSFVLIYPFLWVVSLLPFRLLYALSDVMYVFLYRIFGYRKQTVMANLELALDRKSVV